MKRTDEYRSVADGAADQADALAWLRRQDRWDRRLRALERAPAAALLPTERAPHPGGPRPVAAR